MNAIFAAHNQRGHVLVGIKSSSMDLAAWAKQRETALKHLDVGSLEERPLLDTLSVDELVEITNDLIATLRKRTGDPVVIKYSEDVTIEVRPEEDDNRVLVSCKGRGDTVVNYQSDGLVLDVYAEEEIGTLSSSWFDNADLTAFENGE